MDPKSGLFKDGFHIQYPYIIIDYESQYELRRRVVNDLIKSEWMPQTCNSLEDVVDQSVIKKNNLLLYGCCEPNLPAHQVRHVFQIGQGQLILTEPECTQLDWIDILSLRLMDEKEVSSTKWETSRNPYSEKIFSEFYELLSQGSYHNPVTPFHKLDEVPKQKSTFLYAQTFPKPVSKSNPKGGIYNKYGSIQSYDQLLDIIASTDPIYRTYNELIQADQPVKLTFDLEYTF